MRGWIGFNRVFCPSLFEDRLPDLLYETLLAEAVNENERSWVQQVYERYIEQRGTQRDRAVSAGVAVRRAGLSLHALDDPKQLDYQEQLLRLRELTKECLDGWRSRSSNAAQRIDHLLSHGGDMNDSRLGPKILRGALVALRAEDPFAK